MRLANILAIVSHARKFYRLANILAIVRLVNILAIVRLVKMLASVRHARKFYRLVKMLAIVRLVKMLAIVRLVKMLAFVRLVNILSTKPPSPPITRSRRERAYRLYYSNIISLSLFRETAASRAILSARSFQTSPL